MKRATRLSLLVVLLVGLALPASAAGSAGRTQRTAHLSALESDVLAELNATRAEHGLAPLRASVGLANAARQHSREMLDDGYFAHRSADGTSFDDRIARFYPFSARFRRWAVGENLVWEAPDLSAAEAVKLWMASPPHRRNILDPTWTEIGISALHADHTSDGFGGGEATVITTDFGARS